LHQVTQGFHNHNINHINHGLRPETSRTEEAVEPQVRVRLCESHLVFRENPGHQNTTSPVRLVRDFFIHTFNVTNFLYLPCQFCIENPEFMYIIIIGLYRS
jgi:hypothetical protein